MGGVDQPGQSVGTDGERRHQVQPEQHQIGEVVPTQRLSGKVGVHEPQAAQPRAGDALAPQVGEFDPVRIADPDPGRRAAPIEEDADLTPDVPGHAGEATGELLGEEGRRREPRLGQPFERAPVTGLQPRGLTFDPQGDSPPAALCAESPRAGTLSAGSRGSDQCDRDGGRGEGRFAPLPRAGRPSRARFASRSRSSLARAEM